MSSVKPPRHVALAVVFDPETRRVLMVSSRAHPGMWILPKGGVEEGETSGQAAVRESYEEGTDILSRGKKGRPTDIVAGTPPNLAAPTDEERVMMLTLEAGAGQKRAAVWHIHAVVVSEAAVASQSTWPEAHQRIREWVSLDECLRRIRAWSTNPSTSGDIASQGEVVVEEAEGKQPWKGSKAKKEQKSGAMEKALRHFALVKGFDLSPST